jgi:hypothetical protein
VTLWKKALTPAPRIAMLTDQIRSTPQAESRNRQEHAPGRKNQATRLTD